MKTRSDIISITMKPTRPAWITILAAAILFVMTLWSLWMFGAVVALAPLALTLAFGYDLTHHAKSRQVQILSRFIVCVTLAVVIVAGVYMISQGKTSF
jgi:hypothetical protein